MLLLLIPTTLLFNEVCCCRTSTFDSLDELSTSDDCSSAEIVGSLLGDDIAEFDVAAVVVVGASGSTTTGCSSVVSFGGPQFWSPSTEDGAPSSRSESEALLRSLSAAVLGVGVQESLVPAAVVEAPLPSSSLLPSWFSSASVLDGDLRVNSPFNVVEVASAVVLACIKI